MKKFKYSRKEIARYFNFYIRNEDGDYIYVGKTPEEISKALLAVKKPKKLKCPFPTMKEIADYAYETYLKDTLKKPKDNQASNKGGDSCRRKRALVDKTTPSISSKEKCPHDHLCCPGDIKTVRCAYCGKSMYHEPQEELEGFTMDELDRAVEKSIKDGTNPYLKEEELEVDELGKGNWEYRFNGTEEWITLGNNLTEITDKLNSIIKAHNALVKEVKNGK